MKIRAALACSLVLWCDALLVPKPAYAGDNDPFWGLDKAEHFAASSIIAGGGYALGTALFRERSRALLLGLGAALLAGAAKEGLDAAGFGHPSWMDFAWDAIGGVVGVGIAVTIDVGIHGGVADLRF